MLPDDGSEASSAAALVEGAASQEAGRTAFTLTAVHTRRDNARITCLALDPRLRRLFLGLSNG